MKLENIRKFTARTMKIVITLSILLFVLLFFEMISVEIAKTFKDKEPASHRPDETVGTEWEIHMSGKAFLPDGTPLLVRSENINGKDMEEIYDTNYTPLWQGPKEERSGSYDYLDWTKQKLGSHYMRFLQDRQRISPEMSKALELPVRINGQIKELWRYLPQKNLFVGYEYKGEKIGYLGANGFTKLKTDAQPFGKYVNLYAIMPPAYETPVFLWQTAKQLLTVDFENRRTTIVLDGGNEKISDIRFNYWSFGNIDTASQEDVTSLRPLLQYQTGDGQYHLILQKPNQKIIIQIPAEWKKYLFNHTRITDTKKGVFLYRQTSDILKPENYDTSEKVQTEFFKTRLLGKAVPYSAQLYKVDEQGSLSFINKFDWIKPEIASAPYRVYVDPQEQFLTYATIFGPTVFGPLEKVFKVMPDNKIIKYLRRQNNNMTAAYLEMIQQMYPRKFTVNISLSIAMMAIALWHGWARRPGMGTLVGWLIFVGLFNIAGLLTYLAVNHTDVIKCPVCGKLRGLAKRHCIRCGQLLPEPKEPLLSDKRVAS